jgi:hypothetical protein
MVKPMTADDILPLVASLEPQERVRLMRLITEQRDVDDAALYAVIPARSDEFSTDEDSLAWEAEGWENKD